MDERHVCKRYTKLDMFVSFSRSRGRIGEGKRGADGRVAEGMARFLAEPVPTLSAMFCIV